jgi:hypothetical protein
VKNAWSLVAVVLMLSMNAAQSQNSIDFKDLSGGWIAMTRQADPFDKTKTKVIQIFKENFVFRCEEINMKINSTGFDGLSFPAELKYVIDEQEPVDKTGSFSTYLGGSKTVTRSRYYSTRLSNKEIDALKNAQNLKVAGKLSSSGWTTGELALNGFAAAYDEMCK